jgi:Flp pilus assembly protein CpaB
MVATAHVAQDEREALGTKTARRIERRRPLPGGRAIAGGFLIAVAVVGVFAAYSRAVAVPQRSYVVAARTLEPGTELRSTDLATITLAVEGQSDLDKRGLFTDRRSLVGAWTLGPIGAGEFVQASAVVRRDGPSDAHEISLAIEPARAVGGSLQPGERVHVVATFGGGGDAYSVVVVRGAQVIAVDSGGGGLAEARTVTITLAVATGDDALAVAHAVDAGKLSLVRAGATEPGGAYRPSGS